MPPPGSGPTDALLRIFADVREHLREIGAPPEWVPESIDVHLAGKPKPITLLVPPPTTPARAPGDAAPARRPFKPSEFQEAILEALGGKFLTTDALAAKVGERRRLFKPGGVKDLQDAGLVGHRPGLGYYSTDDPPADLEDE